MAETKTPDAHAKAPEPKATDPKPGDVKPTDAKADRTAQAEFVQEMAVALNRANQINAGAASATPDADKTVPGGKFLVGGKLVNCNGREIDEDGTILHPEELVMDPFGRLV